ncbi:MAG TPA: diacylglycerol kinase family protein [Bacteroidetes bacterium]|nr:diacylglycerol kinase family protein [Bacteroidota bacterium]
MTSQKFSIKKRVKSFKYAFDGLKILFKEEHNARIHLVAAFVVIAASIYYKISTLELSLIVFAIIGVFALEIINTAIENITDFISPEKNGKIKIIKDLAAAAVLVSAIGAVVVAGLIFIPKILN